MRKVIYRLRALEGATDVPPAQRTLWIKEFARMRPDVPTASVLKRLQRQSRAAKNAVYYSIDPLVQRFMEVNLVTAPMAQLLEAVVVTLRIKTMMCSAGLDRVEWGLSCLVGRQFVKLVEKWLPMGVGDWRAVPGPCVGVLVSPAVPS